MSKGGGFKKLYGLGDDKVAEIDRRLQAGEVAMSIVELIQKSWGKLTDDKPETLKKMIERYRGTDFKNKIVAQIAGTGEKSIKATILAKRLNAMDELEQLVMVQKGRVEKALVQESKMNLPLKMASDEIRLLKENLVELGKLQLETGVLIRAPKKLTGTVMGEDGTVRQFVWSEEQAQLAHQLGIDIEPEFVNVSLVPQDR